MNLKSLPIQDQTILTLSMCALLFPVTSGVTGVVMGMMFFFVLFLTAIAVYLLRGLIPDVLRILIILLLAATMATVVSQITRTLWFEISLLFGIYLPLMAINCVVLVNNEEVVLRHSFTRAVMETLRTGAGFMVMLVAIGIVRELLGGGTLFQHAELLFGQTAAGWTMQLIDESLAWGVLLSAPGAFLVLGFFMAVINMKNQGPVARSSE